MHCRLVPFILVLGRVDCHQFKLSSHPTGVRQSGLGQFNLKTRTEDGSAFVPTKFSLDAKNQVLPAPRFSCLKCLSLEVIQLKTIS